MSNPGLWKNWEGRTVDGKFPLRLWLGGSDHSAVFVTERPGQPSSKSAIKLIAADGPESDRPLSRWRVAAQLSHPQLMRIFEFGRCRIDSTPLLYVVMEYAEEDLSQILPQRPLAPPEAFDLLPPLLEALSYLHGKGLVHGRIKPSNVLAVGDHLKLSADHVAPFNESASEKVRRDVYDAPERSFGIVSPAGDLWSVGVTLVEVLTQDIPFSKDDPSSDLVIAPTIPEPFRGIARECLHIDPKRRCSIEEIQARLQPAGRSVPAASPAEPPPRTQVKRGPIAGALLIMAVLVALIVYFSRGKSGPADSASAPASTTPQSQPRAATVPKPTAAVPEEDATPKETLPGQGSVVHQALPEISPSARNTISGTIKVTASVEADPSGKVTSAKLRSAGPSRYFAGAALRAAEQWQFSPPLVNGQPMPSTWLIQFRFKRSGTQASAQPVTR